MENMENKEMLSYIYKLLDVLALGIKRGDLPIDHCKYLIDKAVVRHKEKNTCSDYEIKRFETFYRGIICECLAKHGIDVTILLKDYTKNN